ncbi:MAG: malto-oligosyltrehalose trehalohydrolase [Pirellulales bacterium]
MQRPGPVIHGDGTTTFRVWGPKCDSLGIQLVRDGQSDAGLFPMARSEDGMFVVRAPAANGTRYWVRLPNGQLRPDPATRFQSDGVHGPSQLVDTTEFRPRTVSWRGIPKSQWILYELHVGTFTEEGTYRAAEERLDELVELGVTAIEMMPVAETAGNRNWGYDGVNLYAPRASYGTPRELQQFVDAAHAHGLAVVLDVVYNHFGPEGNYLHDFGGYISTRHRTPWGDSPDFDGSESRRVRDYIVQNALYWIEEYGFDGLRLDAVHCIADDSPVHIVTEIGQAADELRSRLGRELVLIAESNVYDPEMMLPTADGGHGFDAAWSDDFLHSIFAVLRPGHHMSSREYLPGADLQMILQRGFVYEGTVRRHRRRVPLDEPVGRVPRESLICSIQTHDFVGNHPAGLRLHSIVGADAHRAAAALLLLYPSLPMLFMGEEFASDSPFLFFTDFGDQHLRVAVEEGRRREYPQHDWSLSESPLSLAAFEQSKIGPAANGCAVTRNWYRDLLRIRKDWQGRQVLCGDNLAANWDPGRELATLVYRNSEVQAAVYVRMHAATDAPQPIEIELPGPVQLGANIQRLPGATTERRPVKIRLGRFGVAVAGSWATD